MREIGEAIGKIRRVLHVQIGEPDVERTGFLRLEALLRQEAFAGFLAALIEQRDVVQLWIETFVCRGLERRDQLRDLRQRLRPFDPCRRVAAPFVELLRELPELLALGIRGDVRRTGLRRERALQRGFHLFLAFSPTVAAHRGGDHQQERQ